MTKIITKTTILTIFYFWVSPPNFILGIYFPGTSALYSKIWIINMDFILYFIPELGNNTQTRDLPKSKYFTHIYIYTRIRSLARHTWNLKCVFCILYDPLLWTDSFMVFKLSPSQSLFKSVHNMKKVLPADFYCYYLVSNIRNSKRKRKYFSLIKIQDLYISG